MTLSFRCSALACLALAGPPAHAQTPASDSLRLGALHTGAMRRDPRARELALLTAQSRLRQQTLDAEQRPSLSVEGQAQYQSDVARIPIVLPGGVSPPVPPHDTYDARVVAQQRLYDPTRTSRRAVEEAQLADAQARLRVSLTGVRQNVNDLFFAALRAQSQVSESELAITDLEAQRAVAATRVREGTALPSEDMTLRAEVLRRRQAIAELKASRRATLEVLADVTGTPLDTAVLLGAADLAAEVSRARASLADVRARAEYVQFASARALLAKQEDARSAQDKPRVSAFGRVGYGRPGLNPLNDKFDAYWLTGVQLQWSPWTWGTTDRDREVLSLQRQIVSAEEQQFTETLRRGTAQDLASIDRLSATLAADDEIVTLRENIVTETRVRFAEGVVTSAEYVDRQTDVLSARINRALHRVELAQARARFLTTLGLEVQ